MRRDGLLMRSTRRLSSASAVAVSWGAAAAILLCSACPAAAQDAPLPPAEKKPGVRPSADAAGGAKPADLPVVAPLRQTLEFVDANTIRKPDGMVVKYYRVDAVNPEVVRDELTRWISKAGSIASVGPSFPVGTGKNFRTIQNTLRIEEHEDLWPDIEGVLAIIDAPQPQVYVEAKIVEVTFNDDLRVGIGPSNIRVDRPAGDMFFKRADFVFDNVLGVTDQALLSFGSDDKYVKFDYILQLGKSGGEAKVISQPGILVSQGEVASIDVGDEEPIVTQSLSGSNVTASTKFTPVGLRLEVEPLMIGRRLVRARINPRLSRVSDFRVTSTSVSRDVINPVISSREAKTVVEVMTGDTVVISGLDQTADLDERSGIPFLMDIPIAGYLFGATTKRTVKTELVFFVTLKIIRPGEAKLVVPPVERARTE